ncbi:DUF6916 family protein [Kordiimonas lipolytica]|uniref:DUF6916 family protein n=1 Tax=Kordiimonas lipolytica TaxID=1662421 RepID=A0ABV8UBR0_9PROT|nr:hypothetical protein [Kordiimonas lipolytica]
MTSTETASLSIATANAQLFDGGIEKDYQFVAGDLAMPVTLMECKEKPLSAGPDSKRTPFILIFRADVDEAHLMQQTLEFKGSIAGLEDGSLDGLMIHRMMRPANLPEGAYYQVMFN